MTQATLSSANQNQITRVACKRVEQLGCHDARMVSISAPQEDAYRVTLVGTISGQHLELQALVVHEYRDRFSCDNCWIVRHA